MTESDMWDALLEMGVSEEALQIVTDVAGYSKQTLRGVLYSVEGTETFPDEEED